MDSFANIVRRIARVGGGVSGGFMLGLVGLVVMTVIGRPFGKTITGNYEIIQFMAVLTVSFALAYTALEKFHIIVRILVSRLSQRTQAIFETVTLLIGIGLLALMAWASAGVVHERWLTERTDVLLVPLVPFRIIWTFGFILFCLVLLTDLHKTLSQWVRK